MYCAFDVPYGVLFYCCYCCTHIYNNNNNNNKKLCTLCHKSVAETREWEKASSFQQQEAAAAVQFLHSICVYGWACVQLCPILYFIVNILSYFFIVFSFSPIRVGSFFLQLFSVVFFCCLLLLVCFMKHNVLFERECKRTPIEIFPLHKYNRWQLLVVR